MERQKSVVGKRQERGAAFAVLAGEKEAAGKGENARGGTAEKCGGEEAREGAAFAVLAGETEAAGKGKEQGVERQKCMVGKRQERGGPLLPFWQERRGRQAKGERKGRDGRKVRRGKGRGAEGVLDKRGRVWYLY